MQTISEAHLLSVIEEMLAQFPFEILGFHADNGSEYVNHKVARLLDKLRIEFTRSRPYGAPFARSTSSTCQKFSRGSDSSACSMHRVSTSSDPKGTGHHGTSSHTERCRFARSDPGR